MHYCNCSLENIPKVFENVASLKHNGRKLLRKLGSTDSEQEEVVGSGILTRICINIVIICLPCFFPLALILSQLLGIFVPRLEDLSVLLSGIEGLIESAPQLCLQLYIFQQIRSFGLLQIVSVVASSFAIGKTVVQYDVLYKEGSTEREIGLLRKIRYSVLVFPTYLSSLVFRSGVLVLMFSYIPYAGILTIFGNMIIIAVVAGILKFQIIDVFILMSTNVCIMSIGPLKSSGRQSRFNYLFFSSMVIYIMMGAQLIYLLILVNTDPFQDADWINLYLTHCGDTSKFNVVCCVVLTSGVLNLLLMCNSQWGRLDSYLDDEDILDIVNTIGNRYNSDAQDKFDNAYADGDVSKMNLLLTFDKYRNIDVEKFDVDRKTKNSNEDSNKETSIENIISKRNPILHLFHLRISNPLGLKVFDFRRKALVAKRNQLKTMWNRISEDELTKPDKEKNEVLTNIIEEMKEIKETEEREKLDWGRKNKNDKKKNIEKEENDEDMKARKN
ncbi:uncharacterized protein LOC111710751 isoform X3 [Eurytemora carolleeae]|uniref:uncharacterized protein LOC111710751 isoform X3 n=1 Tax=Eurytemora carolleeae TaxID=1294199 RepID=UPI000C759BFF|nr:uncharacterized protein LOC111710751 isoform X3 [Eurytemora carolleeae]|eukprot:XP_023340641.1 uncharacterized protein LOC111710751 isoform X3 [Eurytemora affinis]